MSDHEILESEEPISVNHPAAELEVKAELVEGRELENKSVESLSVNEHSGNVQTEADSALNGPTQNGPTQKETDQKETDQRGTVVLLHGVWAGSWLMSLLAQRLRVQGYHVENWGYNSVGTSLDRLIPVFSQRLQAYQQTLDSTVPLYIVAHSLGAIIMRAAVNEVSLPSLRRIVLLSPPNRGSYFATWVGPYLKWITSLVDELSDREESYVNQLPHQLPEHVQVGVIAAEWDHVLTADATHLDDEVDHITVPSRHSGLVLRKNAAQQILHFLEHGCFLRMKESAGLEMTTLETAPAENNQIES